MMSESPIFMSVRELGYRIKSKDISPVEVTKIFLDRLEKYGPEYNSVVTVTTDLALEQAQLAENEIMSGEYKGPLHGIPYGAKDLLATSGGIPTTWGAKLFEKQTFNYDATVISKLRKSGAILAAKLSMVELAGGMGYRQPNASISGPCKSPWDKSKWAGGSSSGSGSAVGCGLVPFAIGSETWGSILSPANNCGISGLRPTYGRVSRHGAMALSWTLDKLGPLALSADDCGLILQEISGKDQKDPSSSKNAFTYNRDTPRRNKLGIIRNVLDDIDDQVRSNFIKSINHLKTKFEIVEVDIPDLPYQEVTRTIMLAESSSAFESFTEKGLARNLTAPEDRYGPYARTSVLAKDYIKALRIRAVMAQQIHEDMAKFDAFISPTRNTPASPIDDEFRGAITGASRDIMGAVGNALGLPSVSVPNGFTSNKLPTGIQFMGRAFQENKILSIASDFQEESEWHNQHPIELLPKTEP